MKDFKKDVFKEGVSSYSINLLWLDKKKDETQPYICNTIYLSSNYSKSDSESDSEDELQYQPIDQIIDQPEDDPLPQHYLLSEMLLPPAVKWAKQNPNASINIWYDSSLYSVTAQENSFNFLQDMQKQEETNNIQFKDIRDITIVAQNQHLFTSNIPLYFRIDLLKMIICLYSLQFHLDDAAIFSDLEVGDKDPQGKRMNKEELFDDESMEKLKEVCIICAKPSENQFLQVINNERTIFALTTAINACFMRGTAILNMDPDNQLNEILVPTMCHIAFDSTVDEIYKLYKGTQLGQIKIKKDYESPDPLKNEWIKYNPKLHAHLPLGNSYDEGDPIEETDPIEESDPIEYDSSIEWAPEFNSFGYRDFNNCALNIIGTAVYEKIPTNADKRVREVKVRKGHFHSEDEYVEKIKEEQNREYKYIPWPVDEEILEALEHDDITTPLPGALEETGE